MSTWLLVSAIIYSLLVIMTTITSLIALANGVFILLDTPKELYDKTSMNWFGCIFIWFLEFLLNPIVWIFDYILYFFDWLFTVGRR